jgi:ABC-type transport system involved in multi-copper enzyme maturation permease subunit
MILQIALKELYYNVMTPRFITGFVLCLLLIPFSIVISMNEYKSKLGIYEIEKKKADEENQAKAYSTYRPVIVKKPTPLSIFARGISYNAGTRVKVFFGDKPMMTEGKAESRDNPFLNRFFTFDFVSVLIIIISLMAFLFTYDICTAEREQGTLKMMLSNPVSRSTVILGKLIGTFFTLLPMLLFSFGLCLLVVLINPGIAFSTPEWIRIALILLFSIVFMVLFMIIGLFVSSRVQHSGTSIVLCLLLWVTFLFIIPNVSTYAARSFVKTGSVENLQYDIMELEKEFLNKVNDFSKLQKEPDWGMSNYYWSSQDGFLLIGNATKSYMERIRNINGYSEPLRIDYADKKWIFRKNYLDKLEKQQKAAEYLSFLSPSEVFKESVAGLCATNYLSHNDFLEQIRSYREILINYYKENNLFGSYLYFTQDNPDEFMTADEMINYRTAGDCKTLDEFNTKRHGDWKYMTVEVPSSNVFNWKPVDISDLPEFIYKPASVMRDVRNSLIYLGILLALAILLFYLSFLSFLKYDVR